ncbi:oligosaccharyl transferase subunit ost3/OST6, partial [Linderina pennispora]
CGPCQELDKTLRSVARGWKRTGGDRNRVVFGSLDVEDGEQLFSQMKIDKIPRLMIFPADTGPHKFANPQTRELNVNGKTMRAEGLAEKLSELFGVKISADVPIDYSKYLMNACTVVAVIYACTLVYKYISLQFLGRNLFTVATISFVLLMTSGYMWNRINDPPYVGQTGAQEAVLFAPTNQQQYGVETQIVAATYAVCALCIVGLVRHAPRIQNQDQRIFITFAFVVALIMTFSYLNSVFRIKMQGYPYKLLFP